MAGKRKGKEKSRGGDRRFGRLVHSLRRARGLTQKQLADLSDISVDSIRRLEHGAFSPSLDTIRRLCQGLALPLSSLFSTLELAERDGAREIVEQARRLTPQERSSALRILVLLVAALRSFEKSADDE